MPTEECEEPLLRASARRRRDRRSEYAGAPEELSLRFDNFQASVDKLGIDPAVLTRRLGQIPAVDQHVNEPVTRVHRPRHGPVGNGARRVECAGRLERRGGWLGRAVVGTARVIADDVAVELVADLLDRPARSKLGCPQVPRDDMVEQGAYVSACVRC